MKKWAIFLLLLVLMAGGAAYFFHKPAKHIVAVRFKEMPVYLQPFADLPASEVSRVYADMKKAVPGLRIKPATPLPEAAWYAPRSRYRADSIIAWLSRRANDTAVFIGITSKDISTTSGKYVDWGIMGLGYEPGNACVVSTFRLHKSNVDEELFKVCVHELGHNMGLPHCEYKTCYMRDAEGHNYLNEETDFCVECKARLKKKGLRF